MIYLDTSALVKLVVKGLETSALRRFLAKVEPGMLVTSALTRVELLRVAYRSGSEPTLRKAREVLDGVGEVTITQSLLDSAGTLAPPTLRTLDAIHLATALELGEELQAFVAYDIRLLSAAQHAKLPTLTPS